jgi:serine/threonine protein kinase
MPLTVGEYQSTKKLGGFNSEVYEVYHLQTGDVAVAKVVKFSSKEAKLSFTREAKFLTKLNGSSNVIPLLLRTEYREKGVLVFPRMKFDLMQLLLTQPANKFSEIHAKIIFNKVINGLKQCHSKGIAHLDLKPENILLSDSGEVFLGDFGSSLDISKGRFIEGRFGTPLYSAPEILTGNAYDAILSDIWSLGIVCFVMVTGTWPYSAADASNIGDGLPCFISQDEILARIRTYSLSLELQDFLCMILRSQAFLRPSLEEIQSHPWLAIPNALSLSAMEDLPVESFEFIQSTTGSRVFAPSTKLLSQPQSKRESRSKLSMLFKKLKITV